jgi:hypothetical protein
MDEMTLLYQEITQAARQLAQDYPSCLTYEKTVAGQVLQLTLCFRGNTTVQSVKLTLPSIRMGGCLAVSHHGIEEIFVLHQEQTAPVALSLRHTQYEERHLLARTLC